MNLIDIMDSKNCPQDLTDSEMKDYVEITTNKAVVIFKDPKSGGGNAIIVTADLEFSYISTFTYHDVTNLRVTKLTEDSVKVTYSATGKELNAVLSVSDNLITLKEREIL